MLSWEKAATPATAATIVLPVRVPPAGFVPMIRVTLSVNCVAVLPNASRAVTSTWGVIVAPAFAVLGGTVKTSWVAAAGVMVKGALVAPVSPDAPGAGV